MSKLNENENCSIPNNLLKTIHFEIYLSEKTFTNIDKLSIYNIKFGLDWIGFLQFIKVLFKVKNIFFKL